MQSYTLLIATHDDAAREYLAGPFDADGHTAYRAHSTTTATSTLALPVIDIVVLAAS